MAFVFLAQSIKIIGYLNTGLIQLGSEIIFIPILVKLFKKDDQFPFKKIKILVFNKLILFYCLISLIAYLTLSYAIARSPQNNGAVAVAISSSYPLITIVLTIKNFKEKIQPIALVGVVVDISGVMILSLAK